MKKLFRTMFLAAVFSAVLSCQQTDIPGGEVTPEVLPDLPSYAAGEKLGHISYQLLIYTFADSNGDGVGDFNGITEHLDYLHQMGVSAIWLSPAHPADSYHGYDVTDYSALDPKYGTEADFKNLLDKAHALDIKIYMDFVLNHTGKGHPWFLEALSDPSSEKYGWYLISADPEADYKAGKFPMLNGYYPGEWHTAKGGNLGYNGRIHFRVDKAGSGYTLTVNPSTEAAQASNTDPSVKMFIYYGDPGKIARMYPAGDSAWEIVLDINTPWGVLVRTSDTSWDGGTKWGAPTGKNVITMGEPLTLSTTDAQDITFGGQTVKFQGAFGSWMPDINYGKVETAPTSGPFKALVASAMKWIGLGIDGMRLDAVKHIYSSDTGPQNPQFLKDWYDACNAAYHNAGHSDDFYMVGEVWMDSGSVAPYYKGLPACFEFDFWERLKWVLQERTGCYLANDLIGYRAKYRGVRANAIPATILTNHDETRAATVLNRDQAKLKQACAFLMTAEGEPYIYQGEELGYWGKDYDDGGSDELVRAPIVWDKAAKAPLKPLGGKFDMGMITDEISVKNQLQQSESLLWTYLQWTHARNTCPALATGRMSAHSTYNNNNTSAGKAIAAWYMTSGADKALVLHNVAGGSVVLDLPDDKLDKPVITLGDVKVEGTKVTMGANSSAVFQQ